MLIRADMTQRALVLPADYQFVPSPLPGVQRMMLDRVGGEVARATSIVDYAPGARFDAHNHDGGEEILVLSGEFADEHGVYPAGSYLRNPPGSRHAPYSRSGCRLLVKLRQFAADDAATVCIDTSTASWRPGLVPGLQVLPLHQHGNEHTVLVRWAPGTVFQPHRHPGGEEILVLQGEFGDENGRYPAGSWLRNPCDSQHTPFAGDDGALIYVKVGHLAG